MLKLAHCSAGGRDRLPTDVKHIGKRTFPHSEAFDSDGELRKTNTKLLIAVAPAEHAHYMG